MNNIIVPVLWEEFENARSFEAMVGNYRLSVRHKSGGTATWYVDLLWSDPNKSVQPIGHGEVKTVEEAKNAAEVALWRALMSGWLGTRRYM